MISLMEKAQVQVHYLGIFRRVCLQLLGTTFNWILYVNIKETVMHRYKISDQTASKVYSFLPVTLHCYYLFKRRQKLFSGILIFHTFWKQVQFNSSL